MYLRSKGGKQSLCKKKLESVPGTNQY